MTAVMTLPKSESRLMNAEEFFEYVNLPENEKRNLELHRGKVIEMSRPSLMHGIVQVNIAYILKKYAENLNKGVTVTESGLHLESDPDTVYGPDVAFYPNITKKSDAPEVWNVSPPLIAVEVLSDSDRAGKMNAKIRNYLDNGVKVVWLVDVDDETVTVYKSDKAMEVLGKSDRIMGGNEMPDFECEVNHFFLPD